ncbi:hypothetical protein SMACR_00589 [Sordaria macrospora]|uniref:WGS project CABT00000000 data, contig 2.1 n=2 Tax=Sordaria macrospora TaxID=5147 RepID=F7VLJ7_SORMK|nr:uncharacterized protein SMAC_00589 [Sordaria macrospora k-hell]KAA8628037.1 hypothetical protein SMACR_00589 [Sordaria macrospora]KAH7627437.1 hypothetical protein B0T09DRAFT_403787 [Sordaria sp. MPI-SDFR-AT-0083]WPJ59340.1 hypothetical protein SMAC4_00589 [Sordaria macrospora]CCC06375.1 unnamed protein product [Sordaria macrospora k-hell]
MSSPAAQNADRAIGSMSRFPTTAETPAIDADHKNIVTSAQDGKIKETESKSIGNQPANVADVPTIDGAATASTRPVGVYYPSRRPNIFRARAKHLRFPEFDHKPVTSDAVDKSAGDMEEDDDEFTMEDLEELQSAQKEETEKKTKKFVSIVQQTTWGSRVEDLGTVHEVEEE